MQRSVSPCDGGDRPVPRGDQSRHRCDLRVCASIAIGGWMRGLLGGLRTRSRICKGLAEGQERRDRIALKPAHSSGLDRQPGVERAQHLHGCRVRRPVVRHFRDGDGARKVAYLRRHRIAALSGEVPAQQRTCGLATLATDLDEHGDAARIVGNAATAPSARSAGCRSRLDSAWRPQHPHVHVTADRETVAQADGRDGASRIARMVQHGSHRSARRLPCTVERIEAHQQPPDAHRPDHLGDCAVVVEVRVRHDDCIDAAHTERVQRGHDRAAAEPGGSERSGVEDDRCPAGTDQVARTVAHVQRVDAERVRDAGRVGIVRTACAGAHNGTGQVRGQRRHPDEELRVSGRERPGCGADRRGDRVQRWRGASRDDERREERRQDDGHRNGPQRELAEVSRRDRRGGAPGGDRCAGRRDRLAQEHGHDPIPWARAHQRALERP